MKIEPVQKVASPTSSNLQSSVLQADRPLVLEGAIRHWKALERWTPEYLKATVGDELATCMMAPEDAPPGLFLLGRWKNSPTLGRNFVERTVREFLDEYWTTDRAPLYLRTVAPEILGKMADDFSVPEVVSQQRYFGQMLWMGPTNSIAPLHYDPGHTLHGVVRGRKRFLLVDRRHFWRMYPHGVFSGFFPHTSRIPDLDHVDERQYPRVRNLVGYECVLAPGDLLFMPVGWWHQVNTLEPSIAVSFWWQGGLPSLHPISLRAKMFASYQGWVARRRKPDPAARASWEERCKESLRARKTDMAS